MTDPVQLLNEAIDALRSGERGRAENLIRRALVGLASTPSGVPWSPNAKDGQRFREYVRRTSIYLARFAEAAGGTLPEADAEAAGAGSFPEDPSVIERFFRKGILELMEGPTGSVVRLTDKGRRELSECRRLLALAADGSGQGP